MQQEASLSLSLSAVLLFTLFDLDKTSKGWYFIVSQDAREHKGVNVNRWTAPSSSSGLQRLGGRVTMVTFGAALLFGRVCSDRLLSRLI